MIKAATLVAAVALGGASGAVVATAVNDQAEPAAFAEGWLHGPCGGSLPPDPDPCIGAQLMLESVRRSLANAAQFRKWKAANPGEYQRVISFYANPGINIPSMLTGIGNALIQVGQMYFYAKGPAVTAAWPAPNPPPLPGQSDKTPPSSPGGLHVNPPPPEPSD